MGGEFLARTKISWEFEYNSIDTKISWEFNWACNSHSITYVPLYDTLGANAVEFIINHAEVSIAFFKRTRSLLKAVKSCGVHLVMPPG
ncbi:long chain acyl-CoA synthetase 2 [Prunus yedoensis var. nudiflora]|uniref:Long chain acyl-CoA synthetase 2 n=1 Tax=Prunus yedoensis var. nudiflora TaxID=2094558 RepID=A0A314XZV5_PRUYE|nr:long chain acyl-CoA synthetase 2 [Prunus yedoensis var. nudiflora]